MVNNILTEEDVYMNIISINVYICYTLLNKVNKPIVHEIDKHIAIERLKSKQLFHHEIDVFVAKLCQRNESNNYFIANFCQRNESNNYFITNSSLKY